MQIEIRAEVKKVNTDQRLVTGWASVVTDAQGNALVDHQGDVIPIAELEKAVHAMFLDGGVEKGGDMHQRMGTADIVESFVVTKEKREALGFGPGPEGWVITMKVNDDKQWEDIKSGKKLEFSIAGEAERVAI